MKKSLGFTLAEVLITIGVIGVVAALTIPSLMAKNEERVLVNRLKQTYSIFSQAYMLAVEQNEDPTGWDLGERDTTEGAKKLYDILKVNIKRAHDCGNGTGCFASNYKALVGDTPYIWQPNTYPLYIKGMLPNGTSFLTWSGGSGCTGSSLLANGKTYNTCGVIKVDLNGNNPPNRAGVDYFNFLVTTEGIIPSYNIIPGARYGEFCKYNDPSDRNGLNCTGYVIKYGKMDYLRRDVSGDN